MREWRCQSKGDCCRENPAVAMTFAEAKLLEQHAAKATRPLQFMARVEPGMVNLVAGPCPFLHGNLCGVYDVRPFNCRRGGCFRWNPHTEPYANNAMPKILADPDLRKSYDRQQTKAQRWGITMGWTA